MKDISILDKTDINIDGKGRTYFMRTELSDEKTNTNPVIEKQIAKGEENFIDYLLWLGLANEPNLLVLSSGRHYYYDYEDLKGVRALINLKKMNLIKKLDDFLFTVYNVLSPKTDFIGCFSDCKTQKGISLFSRIRKKFINFLDLRTYIEIDKKDISRLLESHGFKIIDMTEINGLTYFLTHN